MAETSDLERRRIRTDYVNTSPLSHGAHSSVLRATQASSGMLVAVKVFKRSEAALSTFDREVEVYRHLFGETMATPFVVEPFDAYRCMREAWIVMELGSRSLRKLVERRQKTEVVSQILKQIVMALRHIHSRSVAHRDVKPENMVMVGDDLKLCDFGLACICTDNERRHTMCGTPNYMAPEMFRRLASGYDGPSVDVWSLGVLAYELLHGRRAFEAACLQQLAVRIRKGMHAPVRKDLPAPFRNFLTRCMCLDPAHRSTSAALAIPVPKKS